MKKVKAYVFDAPSIEDVDPSRFASDLVSSGELVLVGSMNKDELDEVNDPLRGCRYVAAMELAYEPRIRKQLPLQRHMGPL